MSGNKNYILRGKDMERMKAACGNCAGVGKRIEWGIQPGVYDEDGFHKAIREEIVCEACNGKGYTEYAVFSVEEAEAILKHCGLSTES